MKCRKDGEKLTYIRNTEKKQKIISADKRDSITSGLSDVFAEFAVCMKNGETTDSAAPQNDVKSLQSYITKNCYICTNEILAGLGQIYVCDERFRKTIGNHSDKTADFASKAIEIYCAK